MQKQLLVGERAIVYTLKRHRAARRLTLSVYPGGRVVLTMPWRSRVAVAEQFLRQKTRWLIKKVDEYKTRLTLPSHNVLNRHYQAHKVRAHRLIFERAKEFSSRYALTVCKVRIKNQKTRWGSCSKKGTISFNYKILFLPERLRDYIIVHELCHIIEFNHSPKFWGLVAKTIPDYNAVKIELRRFCAAGRIIPNF